MGAPRAALLPAVMLLALVVAPTDPVAADPPRCTCRDGNACYHFLNAPVVPPDDPCSCPLCRAAQGACPKKIPRGWDRACYGNGKMECFLRRHAASWSLSCSERLSGKCGCRKNPHQEFCPYCGSSGRQWDEAGLELIKRQVASAITAFQSLLPLSSVRTFIAVGGDARWAATQAAKSAQTKEPASL